MRPLIFCRPAQQALSCLRTPGSSDPAAVLSPLLHCLTLCLCTIHQGQQRQQIRGRLAGRVQNMQVKLIILYPLMKQECVRGVIIIKKIVAQLIEQSLAVVQMMLLMPRWPLHH